MMVPVFLALKSKIHYELKKIPAKILVNYFDYTLICQTVEESLN